MDLIMRLARKVLSTTKFRDAAIEKIQEVFLKEENIDDLEGFHLAILDMFAAVNKALPGKHWVVPPLEEIKKCYDDVDKVQDKEKKKELVVNFMKEKIKINKADSTLLFIGLATPPAAMAAKKAGEAVPPFKFIKRVPDVLFVPAATLLSLVAVKISRSLLPQHAASENRLVARKKQAKSNQP